MKSSKLQKVALGLVLITLVALTLRQHRCIKTLTQEAAGLRQQLAEVETLRAENERLNSQFHTANQRSTADSQELLRLRNQAARSRQLEQENARLKLERGQLTNALHASRSDQPTTSNQGDDPPNTPEQRYQNAKAIFGRDLGMALIRAAQVNGGNIPAELRGPLFETVESLSGGEYEFRAKHFELVYQGSLRDAKNLSDIILAREREPVQGLDGKWKRLYVLGDGHSQWVSADSRDGFAAREQQFWPGHFNQK